MIKGKGTSGFGYGSTAEEVTEGIDLTGKTYLLTGCNSGLGLETLRVLSLRGAHIFAAARTEEKAKNALSEANATGTPFACELSIPNSVQACVDAIKAKGQKLDGIICNAGIMALPKLNKQMGYELQFFTNHIGHFILVTGLVDSLTEDGRIVMVSSEAHRGTVKGGIQLDNLDGAKGYSAWKNYGQSKLANLLFAKQLAKRFEGSNRTANAIHPGVIKTNLARSMNPAVRVALGVVGPIFLKNIPQGTATQCYVATHPNATSITGEYLADCNLKKPTKYALDEKLAEQLWEASEKIVKEVLNEE